MSLQKIMLGLLEREPRHGYELRQLYDQRFSADRPINPAQIYSALGRLERTGHVVVEGMESGRGPDRTVYAITGDGVTDLARWLEQPEPPQPWKQDTIFAKVVLSILTGRDAQQFLDRQRLAHLERMRELTRFKRSADFRELLLADHALFHVEADLQWLEITAERLIELQGALQ